MIIVTRQLPNTAFTRPMSRARKTKWLLGKDAQK
jgi:hypothetical protein